MREHNEDAHYYDAEGGVFVVCDGMGGHAAGEVASALAIQTVRTKWSSTETQQAIDQWLSRGSPEAKKQLLAVVRGGVIAAHNAILADAQRDTTKSGMGTTLVGGMLVGNELMFAHAGDSRAYIVRDGIAMQLTEDHTLLSRLLAAGIDVDVSGEGSRFRSMLTNALGIGQECKVSTFVVPLADGDRFLLCSDGISEYVPEAEVGSVLVGQASPARAAQKLIELALQRGGGDNATAVVVRVLEAGDSPQPVEHRRKDDAAIQACRLWDQVSPQQRLRALRIALTRDIPIDERLPAYMLGDRVAWIIIEGQLEQRGQVLGPGSFVYPESLVSDAPPPDRDSLAMTRSEVRGLVLRSDDFRELCDEDAELGEVLLETLGQLLSRRGDSTRQSEAADHAAAGEADEPIPLTHVTTPAPGVPVVAIPVRSEPSGPRAVAAPIVTPPFGSAVSPTTGRIATPPRAIPTTPSKISIPIPSLRGPSTQVGPPPPPAALPAL
ncbi:MAG: protein phosphatase 2C domain-containing protein, partial [Myxococcota bacterium]|nr:protein phosphatase 2C domain-containing protein [Myxococcota bacterium]